MALLGGILGSGTGGATGGLLGGSGGLLEGSGGLLGGVTGGLLGSGTGTGTGGLLGSGGLLGLDLGGLLGGVTDTVNGLLGSGTGDVLGGILPGGLVDGLGDTLNDVLAGGSPTGLLAGLLDNNLLDLSQLQDVLNGGGALDLGSLDNLLSTTNLSHLSDVLGNVFDTGLLGGTVLDQTALGQLGIVDLGSTTTLVTNLVGAILDVAGSATDISLILDSVLATDDTLRGTNGSDTLDGRAGDDMIYGGNGDDFLSGGDGNDKVYGGNGDDNLHGNAGNDELYGGNGNDVLFGDAGADKMYGGNGDDIYYVDNASDVVSEKAGQGVDMVVSSITYTLGANVEKLSLVGTTALNGTGNTLDNLISGNDGANKLSGLAGNDILIGRSGVDTLTGGSGNDIFRFQAGSDSGIGVGNRDVITDFSTGDKVDFKLIDANTSIAGDQAFHYMTGAFNNDGTAQVRVTNGNGFSLISGDANGDGKVDFQIELTGTHHLTASDFIL